MLIGTDAHALRVQQNRTLDLTLPAAELVAVVKCVLSAISHEIYVFERLQLGNTRTKSICCNVVERLVMSIVGWRC